MLKIYILYRDVCTITRCYFQVKPNEILQSSNAVYEVLEFIGRGTFGQVIVFHLIRN